MRFEWNAEKNLSNLRKHGVSFDTAIDVFDDPEYVMEQDREVDGEERCRRSAEPTASGCC